MIGPIVEKIETMEVPQNRRVYGKMEFLPLWPTYIGERSGGLLGKTHGIKGAIGNTLGEHIGNLTGTHWEPEGRYWEQRKNEKNPHPKPPPTPKLKKKKSRHFESMLSLPVGYMKFLFSKLFITIFGLG